MGFCRRCGEIVFGVRCKCGGAAVAPSIALQHTGSKQTATSTSVKEEIRPSYTGSSFVASQTKHFSSTPVNRDPPPKFPRLAKSTNNFQDSTTGARVSSHINSTLTQRPSSPLKNASTPPAEIASPTSPCDIFTDPLTSTLSKAYGSILQPKETLTAFCCAVCSDPFLPDATIYPDPSDLTTTTRFLCKPCFTSDGGSKGDCASCKRPVLILTSEGGFVENGGRVWHRRCFRCDGCFKDVGNSPMVDLLGRPTCDDCFDSCLKRPNRDSPSARKFTSTPERRQSTPVGLKGSGSREPSPIIEELHQRFGIKSRESSPLVDLPDKSDKFDPIQSSPLAERSINRIPSTLPEPEKVSTRSQSKVENWKNGIANGNSVPGRYERFRPSHIKNLRSNTVSSIRDSANDSDSTSGGDRRMLPKSLRSSPSLRSVSPATTTSRDSMSYASSTPDLTDFSDTNTVSSGPSTPPSSSPSETRIDVFSHVTPTKSNQTPTKTPTKSTPTQFTISSPSTPCAKCSKPLFRTHTDGKFVTVPEESSKRQPPKSYHIDCFRCAVCSEPFEATKNGQAVFIRSSSGCCHVGCATPERIVIKPLNVSKPKSMVPSTTSFSSNSNKVHFPTPAAAPASASGPAMRAPTPKTAPPVVTTFPRFGSGTFCPGCFVSVGPMEKGVVPGPQGSRWHASCLVCGGKAAAKTRQRNPDEPGCGKRLDSAAKTDGEGGVWCRECRMLLPDSPHTPGRQQDPSPTRPITPSHTGSIFSRFPPSSGLIPQSTGTTTIARQFTGMSASALSVQLTGASAAGLSPTRQLTNRSRSPSPVKLMAGGRFPRPKSVLGVRGKSVDEGRGMFLVRQMTGGGQNFGL
ncbi:hypothetical protein SCHPADRAFT_991906 [Schizopora paradoxa]|uniref:LIM zinc-binding domain-containing protein n=1 Tax=Schizopora paradoxa TaxID=27342 RepID=A0A0H2S9M4_9AGAM|nr:hypothetical protein SCHPADRAFT_991906 [Schizopora paradoxa]